MWADDLKRENGERDLKPIDIERAKREAKLASMPAPSQHGKLFAALAAARGEFDEIPKTRRAIVRLKDGGQYSYMYADLADVFSATTAAMAAYGLATIQYVEGSYVATMLTHSSGQYKVFHWPLKAMPKRGLDDAQSHQSAVQVAKRYALTAILGISTEETIEGDDARRIEANRKSIDDNFRSEDGVRHPMGAIFNNDMTPRQKAEEAARAIEEQLESPKTPKGLNGVWNRNDMFIDRLAAKHDDLYQSIFEKFHARMAALSPEDDQ